MKSLSSLTTQIVTAVLGLATLYVVLDNSRNVRSILSASTSSLTRLYSALTRPGA